eukprot:gene35640-43945_t
MHTGWLLVKRLRLSLKLGCYWGTEKFLKSDFGSKYFPGSGKVTDGKIETQIKPATTFYPAQQDHQNYLEMNPGGYCNHGYRFKSWPAGGSDYL